MEKRKLPGFRYALILWDRMVSGKSRIAREMFSWKGFAGAGNRDLLHPRRVVHLISTGPKHPTGRTPWVVAARQAVHASDYPSEVLLTSIGNKTWEFQAWVASESEIPQILILPSRPGQDLLELTEELVEQLNLPEGRWAVLAYEVAPGQLRGKGWQLERDRVALNLADRIVPLVLRPGGKLEHLLKEKADPKAVDWSRKLEWEPPKRAERRFRFNPTDIEERIDPLHRDHLIHWTRASDGPWPGETLADYYRALSKSEKEYPRSGRATLNRILRESRLRGSAWKIRGGQPVVAFSALPPSQAIALMRWRKRYARYSIEPYGVAIDKQAALEVGIRPVSYVGGGRFDGTRPPYLLQGAGEVGDWPAEREYRHPGDLDLSRIAGDAWRGLDLPKMLE
jgi:hypothetical protein